jgi:enterochelin esterase-like enzyme
MKQILILTILCFSINIFSQDRNYLIDTIRIKSDILNENRIIIIHKSPNFSKNDSVQFIYCIDRESTDRFHRLNERINKSIQNFVVVGIVHTDRRRDLLYVKGADKFFDFVTTELIPAVEKDCKTKNRILYGHSFGGAFTVYSMIQKPSYFNLYIASSPTPIMGLIKKEYYLQIDSSSNRTLFYFSYGSKDMRQVRKWSNRLKDNLTGLEFNNFEWRFEIFEGKNHNNSD